MERDENGTVSVAAILRTEELASAFFHETEYRLDLDSVDGFRGVVPRLWDGEVTPETIAEELARQASRQKDDLDAHFWLDGATTALSLIVRLREG